MRTRLQLIAEKSCHCTSLDRALERFRRINEKWNASCQCRHRGLQLRTVYRTDHQSALAHTLADIEVVVGDDGSTDETVAQAKQFGDSRLRICEQPHRGAPFALNAGVNLARAPYIGFLDHDDLWAPEKLARRLEFFENSAVTDATFSWSALVDESGGRIGLQGARRRRPIGFPQLLEDFVVGSTSSLVLRRPAILGVGGFDMRFHAAMTWISF